MFAGNSTMSVDRTALAFAMLAVAIIAVNAAAIGHDISNSTYAERQDGSTAPSPVPETADARMKKQYRRMIFPLFVGILMKVTSLIPVILGKLAMLAVGSIFTSKLALFIAAILIIHKWHTETSVAAVSEEPYHYPYRRIG